MNAEQRQKELVRLAGLFYVERLKKWPEVDDDTRIIESVNAATHIIIEAKSKACLVAGGHDFRANYNVTTGSFQECTQCGKRA